MRMAARLLSGFYQVLSESSGACLVPFHGSCKAKIMLAVSVHGEQVARKWEQCNAEGVLLRAGAGDPEADRPIGPMRNGVSGAAARPAAGHGVQHRGAAASGGEGGEAGPWPARVQPCGSFSSVRAQAGSVGTGSDDGAAPPAPGSGGVLHALRARGWLPGGELPQSAPGLPPERWGYAHWAAAACAVGAAAVLAVQLTRSRAPSSALR